VIDPVELTQKLVRCRSITPADDGALDVIADALIPLGFEINKLTFHEEGFPSIDNVFARFGTDGPHLCYMGHTDVVPPGDESEWKYPPFDCTIDNGIVYGRGTADMKGGNAAFIAAVSRLFNEQRPKGSISLLITGDEEAHAINGTVKVIDWMQKNGQMPDVALVGEPSNSSAMGQAVRIGRRGSMSGRITIKGIQGHSAYPERADNPVPKMVRLLNALISTKFDDGTENFAPTHLVVSSIDAGNTASNVIPSKVSAIFNMRFNNLWTRESLVEKLHEIMKATGEPYELEMRPGISRAFMTKPGEWTSLVADAIEKVSGKRPKYDTGGGTSDARFIAPFCPVVEYGVLNATIHKVDEHTTVSDLNALTETYYEILRKYLT
jgi:succinyl-diaminopimelate desuccinylase